MKVSKGLDKVLSGESLKEFLQVTGTKNVLDKIGFNNYDEVILLSDIHNALSKTANILNAEECVQLRVIIEHIRAEHATYKSEIDGLIKKFNGITHEESLLGSIIAGFHKKVTLVDNDISEKRIMDMEISQRRSCLYFLAIDEHQCAEEIKNYKETTFTYDNLEESSMPKATKESLKQAFNVFKNNRKLAVFYPDIYTEKDLSVMASCLIERFVNEHKAVIIKSGVNKKEDRLEALADIFGVGEHFHDLDDQLKLYLRKIINEANLTKDNLVYFAEENKREYVFKIPEHRVVQVANGIEKEAIDRFLRGVVEQLNSVNNKSEEVDKIMSVTMKPTQSEIVIILSNDLSVDDCFSIMKGQEEILRTALLGNSNKFNQIYLESGCNKHLNTTTIINSSLERHVANAMKEIVKSKGCSSPKINMMKVECLDALKNLYETQEKQNKLNVRFK